MSTANFTDIALNPAVIAAMIAATSAGFGGLLGWFFNRLVARNAKSAENAIKQLEGWTEFTQTLLSRIQFMEDKDLKMDEIVSNLRERILQCEKERISLTRENVRLTHSMR